MRVRRKGLEQIGFFPPAIKGYQVVLTSNTARWFFAGQIRVAGLNILMPCTESGYG